jgi:hypothetical protein
MDGLLDGDEGTGEDIQGPDTLKNRRWRKVEEGERRSGGGRQICDREAYSEGR